MNATPMQPDSGGEALTGMKIECVDVSGAGKPDPELGLLHRVGAGDRDALATLYRLYRQRLHRFIGRITSRADLIDEAINDSFWVVWKKASGFRGDSRVSTWIFGIAYRCTLKVLRRRNSEPQEFDDIADAPAELHDPRATHETLDWLAKGMARLPEGHRLVLELAYADGHSIEEIAAILDCPVGTVKARMFHARMKLRNLLPMLAGEHRRQNVEAAR